MRSILSGLSTAVAIGLTVPSVALAAGQEAPAAATAQAAPPVLPVRAAPAGTIIELALTKPVGSKLSKRGDRFGVRLVNDLKLDGVVVLPAGIEGEGEVVHAAPAKMGGGPGELLLAARFLDNNGVRVPLKALKLGRSGADNGGGALAVAIVAGPLGFLVQGGEVEIPAGTVANAKLAADLPMPASPAPISNP